MRQQASVRKGRPRAALFLSSVLAIPVALAVAAEVRTIDAGESVRGRAIVAQRQGKLDAPTQVLAIGQIHGDEPGGLRVIEALRRMSVPRGVALWTVRSVNPDGAQLGIRQNVRGIDLNRNFPRGWREQPAREAATTAGAARSRSRNRAPPRGSYGGSGHGSRSGFTSRTASW